MHNIANKFAYIKKKQYFCALNCVSVRLCAWERRQLEIEN